MRQLTTLTMIIPALLAAHVAGAQNMVERELDAMAERVEATTMPLVKRALGSESGQLLSDGERARIAVTAEPGTKYLILGACERRCPSITVKATRDGQTLSTKSGERVGMVYLTEATETVFYVSLSCPAGNCDWGLRVYRAASAPRAEDAAPAEPSTINRELDLMAARVAKPPAVPLEIERVTAASAKHRLTSGEKYDALTRTLPEGATIVALVACDRHCPIVQIQVMQGDSLVAEHHGERAAAIFQNDSRLPAHFMVTVACFGQADCDWGLRVYTVPQASSALPRGRRDTLWTPLQLAERRP